MAHTLNLSFSDKYYCKDIHRYITIHAIGNCDIIRKVFSNSQSDVGQKKDLIVEDCFHIILIKYSM